LGELDLQLVGDLSGLARMCAVVECVCLEDGGRVVGGDGGVFRRIGLVGLESWDGKRYRGGRGGGRGESQKRAAKAKTEVDTVGRRTEAEAEEETDRQTASQWWNVLLPAATAIKLEAAGPCLRCRPKEGPLSGWREPYSMFSKGRIQ
jgi:hypothetical protein